MPSEMHVQVNISGAVFDGRAEGAARAFLQDAQVDVARAATNDVHLTLHEVLRHPTGYYESRVVTDRAGGDPRVWDQNVVYGPWLEGTGSRNRSTRFKGYFTFRRVTQRIKGRVGAIVRPILDHYVREMNR